MNIDVDLKEVLKKLITADNLSKLIITIVGGILFFTLMISGKVFLYGFYLGEILQGYNIIEVISVNLLDFDYKIEILIGIILLTWIVIEFLLAYLYCKKEYLLVITLFIICSVMIYVINNEVFEFDNFLNIFYKIIGLQLAIVIMIEYLKSIILINNLIKLLKYIYYICTTMIVLLKHVNLKNNYTFILLIFLGLYFIYTRILVFLYNKISNKIGKYFIDNVGFFILFIYIIWNILFEEANLNKIFNNFILLIIPVGVKVILTIKNYKQTKIISYNANIDINYPIRVLLSAVIVLISSLTLYIHFIKIVYDIGTIYNSQYIQHKETLYIINSNEYIHGKIVSKSNEVYYIVTLDNRLIVQDIKNVIIVRK